ncbi:hypothetical protein BDV97DRAFT_181852 [Delphinella strobiligena]|nr:hypothetical protein BDV97DRAFT_181852 [Delphinella strobiligena]
MGICASCLGRRRQEPSETEALLYEDASQPQYGAIGTGTAAPGPDPEELRREREALELICAQTSNELIDVLHHNAITPGSKMASDYSDLLNKHFPNASRASSPTTDDEAAWLSDTQGTDRELWEEVKGLSQGHLVLTLNTPSQPNGVPAR